jgi:hypothetical protein
MALYHGYMVLVRYFDRRRLKVFWRAVVEVAFIIFLFYANLLMGEFTHTAGHGRTIWMAMKDIVTGTTCAIALVSSIIGYLGLEYVRKSLIPKL